MAEQQSEKQKNETTRVQITLDSWVSNMLSAIEAKGFYGETKKDVVNNILREYLREKITKASTEPEIAKLWGEILSS